MADRFRFMVKRGDLKSDTEAVTAYEELHRKWDNLLIKFIYSIKTKKSDSIEKMIPQIVKLKEQEEEVLKKVINEIKENLLVMDENSIYSKVNFFEALRNLDSNVSQVRKLEFDIEAKNKDKEELLIGFDSDNTVMLSEEHLHIKLKLSGKKLKVFDKTEYEEYEFEKETFVEPLHIIISVNYEKQSYSMIGMQNGKEQVKIEDAKFGNPLYPLMTINQYVFCSPPLSLYKMKNLKID